MKFLKRRRGTGGYMPPLEDPLSGVANLFDAGIVFIVSMMIALFMAFNMLDMLDPESEITITKKNSDGQVEIITKKGQEITARKVTDSTLSGQGARLGTAYELEDGRVIYVPD